MNMTFLSINLKPGKSEKKLVRFYAKIDPSPFRAPKSLKIVEWRINSHYYDEFRHPLKYSDKKKMKKSEKNFPKFLAPPGAHRVPHI